MPERPRYIPHPLDALDAIAAKLGSLADLVGTCSDIGVVNTEGLSLLISDMAEQVEEATKALRMTAA
jgi:hypothetical protein